MEDTSHNFKKIYNTRYYLNHKIMSYKKILEQIQNALKISTTHLGVAS